MSQDWIQLHDQEIDVGPVVNFVTDCEAGGIALFLGTTRAETTAAGQGLVALDYDAYGEMANRQLHDLARRARQHWPIRRLAVLHRTGRVALGQASVVIAVSSAHRGEALDACRWLIDTVKAEVAIWKKEVWADGASQWVHPGG